MSGQSGFLPEDRRAWLLEIGRRLQAEYDAVAEPVPERLTELLRQLEGPLGESSPDRKPQRPLAVEFPLPLDPDGHLPSAFTDAPDLAA
jgi:hypothetical protein